MKTVISILFIIFVQNLCAQTGTIRGDVFEESTGEPLPFVVVLAEGTSSTAITDLDGKFELQLEPGTYKITFTLSSYHTAIQEDIIVKANEVQLLNNIKMTDQVIAIKEFEVKAEFKKNTENAMLAAKAKSANMIDGISSAAFKKTGDGDAASAAKRVPGISINNGKYIYVRGLGDRYNKTVLNGLDIPGLDPDRNSLQMDIFPTSIIENMVVNKTFIAELPADFTGGVINLELKSFPEERLVNFQIQGSYNPYFHFNKDFLTYEGGKYDFLGFDDGTRAIPATTNIPLFADVVGNMESSKADRYKQILGSFGKTMAAHRESNMMDFGVSTAIGNQFKLKKYSLGYNVLLSYSHSTEYYKDAEYGNYGLSQDSSIYEMNMRILQKGDMGVTNVIWSGLGGLAIKNQNNKFVVNLLHIQNSESTAGIFDYTSRDLGADYDAFQHSLTFTQRSLSNAFVSGKHVLKDPKWNIEWKTATTYSVIKDPDFRITRYQLKDSLFAIGTEVGFPERIWRDLTEINAVGNLAIEKEYTAFDRKASVHFGTGYTYKNRDYIIRNFAMNLRGDLPLTGDPNEIMSDSLLWPYNGSIASGTTYEAPFIPINPNQYQSNVNNSSIYISNEMLITPKLKTIIGVRAEYYVHRYTGQNQQGTIKFDNAKVLENLGIFPSLNLVYAVTEKQNLRFAYGKTVARPSFKELSYAEIYDPITGRTFIGGLFKDSLSPTKVYWDGNLVSTSIHNIDLRWEVFPAPGRTISVSAFYKYFINPIEIIQYATQNGSFQPRNVGTGQVVGGEFEIRENLGIFTEKLNAFDFVLNLTGVNSRIELNQIEYESRLDNARDKQEVKNYRQMAGQAPYIINGGFAFNGMDKGFAKGLEIGLFYNVQGPTLQFVGIVDRPDIYAVPFHSLNLNASKKFGARDHMAISIRVNNLLNDKTESVYRSFGADDQYFTRLAPGRIITGKFSINF
jgi:hypothetical protein